MGLLTLLEAGGIDVFKGAALLSPPRTSESEGLALEEAVVGISAVRVIEAPGGALGYVCSLLLGGRKSTGSRPCFPNLSFITGLYHPLLT